LENIGIWRYKTSTPTTLSPGGRHPCHACSVLKFEDLTRELECRLNLRQL
jgi:hypothetical protein